ncbi:nickel-dependent lactate racemase [Anaeroselena agilis]|uniref:Nickel-dependent lactate racemase n=1 Tax=Anaeroselena agilis TaxID=3063788 RepID=A0ABU3NXQ0_9FIRM|nr:nickel-dependent lactate racemase [Selenomonadales bacterium 4137-cl]
MKKVRLAYGKTGLEISVPDAAAVIEPHHLPGLTDEKQAVLAALRAPIGAPPLRSMVRAADTVAIVISDLTRPTPNHKLVPWLLEELGHVPRENFVIINGLGSHRANTRDELILMLGREVVDTVRIENHDAFDDARLVRVGRNTYGSEVYLNKTYVEAAFKIVVGFIEPHFFAGFSGGPKGIQPGVAGIKTILDFHNAHMIGHPNSTWGVIDGNILQDAATQNCLLAKPDFMLNVTLNGDKEITNVFAGDVIEAHRLGCRFVKESAMHAVDRPFDIVVTTNSGYPLDQNLYQTVKGMSAAAQIVRQGGAIVSASECSDGVPDHGNYAKILQMRETPRQLLEMIEDPAFSMFDQWQVQVQAIVQLKADCYLYSTLDAATVANAKFTPISDLGQTLAALAAKYGPAPRIAVLPYGPLTIPYVK